jgi:hypothetical protein
LEPPQLVKKIFFKIPCLGKKLGIKYVWLFSEKKYHRFSCLFKISNGPCFLFKLIKFSLKNEIKNKSKKKMKIEGDPVLLLNNFSSVIKEEKFLEKTFKEFFSLEREKKKITFQKQKNAIFIDNIRFRKSIEIRFYKFWGTILLYPRVLRKKNVLNRLNKIKKKILVKLILNSTLSKSTPNFFPLNIEEIGPRITLKFLELLKRF